MQSVVARPELATADPLRKSDPADASLSSELYGLGVVALIGLALIVCVAGLRSGPIMSDHECIVAQTARQSVQSGEWLIPSLGEIPRIRKTPLSYWLVGMSSYVFDDPHALPVTNYSARMPSAIAGVLNALIVCWLGTMLFGRRAGLVAGFIAATCIATVVYARNAQVDMILTMFNTLSFALFWRGTLHDGRSSGSAGTSTSRAKWAMAAFYVAFGVAMMAKGPLPIATVGASLFVFWFATLPWLKAEEKLGVQPAGSSSLGNLLHGEFAQQLRGLWKLWLIPGLIVFSIISFAWWAYAYWYVGHELHLDALRLWKMEYADRFSGELSDKHQPIYYYVPMLLGFMVPFTLSLPEALVSVFLKRYRAWRVEISYVLTWAVVGTVFISMASYKRQHYILSMIPAYCLLLAPAVDRLFFGRILARPEVVRLVCRAVAPLLMAAAVIGGVYVHRALPSIMGAYIATAISLTVVWTVAGAMFGRGRRTLSFAVFNLAVPIAILLSWPALGVCLGENAQVQSLAHKLQQAGVAPDDPIYWVGGRPDSSIEFYSGYHIRRLVNELEMAEHRENRRTVDDDLLEFMANRIRERLAEPKPVYLIMASGNYELMRRETNITARKLFELTGFNKDPGDELVVITQAATSTRTAEAK